MTYDEAVAYINEAGDDKSERGRRKLEVFHIIYGITPARPAPEPLSDQEWDRLIGTITGRFTSDHPNFEEI